MGSLSKPFTSDTLIKAVRRYLAGKRSLPNESKPSAKEGPRPIASRRGAASTSASPRRWRNFVRDRDPTNPNRLLRPRSPRFAESGHAAHPGGAYFCGDSSFFSLHWALQTIAREKLTGTLRAFWAPRLRRVACADGRVRSYWSRRRNPSLYCEEAPVTLLNVERAGSRRRAEPSGEGWLPDVRYACGKGLSCASPLCSSCSIMGSGFSRSLWTDRVPLHVRNSELPDYARSCRPPRRASINGP